MKSMMRVAVEEKNCKRRERQGGDALHTTRKRTRIYVRKNEKGETRSVSFFDYHIYHHPLRPVTTDSANVKIINRQGSCCLWVILMHLSSMLGQFFVFSGILQANRKLRYLLQASKNTLKIHICFTATEGSPGETFRSCKTI